MPLALPGMLSMLLYEKLAGLLVSEEDEEYEEEEEEEEDEADEAANAQLCEVLSKLWPAFGIGAVEHALATVTAAVAEFSFDRMESNRSCCGSASICWNILHIGWHSNIPQQDYSGESAQLIDVLGIGDR